MQSSGQVELAGADFVTLGAVHPHGHELQVGDYVVQFRADGAGNDVVNGELVASLGPDADRWSVAAPHRGQAFGVQTT